jgi:hypothetical protein
VKLQGWISHHFWVVMFASAIYGALLFRVRSRKYISKDPGLKEGYDQLFWKYFISTLPVPIIMMVGMALGKVQSGWSYLRPQDRNPWVIAFYSVFLTMLLVDAWWIFFRRGAEQLVKYPGLPGLNFKRGFSDSRSIKIIMGLMVIGMIVGVLVMVGANVAVPTSR